MENKISEEEQRQLFIEHWYDNDVQLVCEVPVFCRSVDLVKYNQKEQAITAVEFKTHNWKRALEQVISTAVSFDYLEICVQKPKTRAAQEKIITTCGEHGVGIYFMEKERQQFEHVLLPQRVKRMWQVQKTQVIRFIERGGCVLGEQ